MSMTTLVILRFAGIFAAYTGLTVLLPAIMFRRILACLLYTLTLPTNREV